jgi:hypothetical protein
MRDLEEPARRSARQSIEFRPPVLIRVVEHVVHHLRGAVGGDQLLAGRHIEWASGLSRAWLLHRPREAARFPEDLPK